MDPQGFRNAYRLHQTKLEMRWLNDWGSITSTLQFSQSIIRLKLSSSYMFSKWHSLSCGTKKAGLDQVVYFSRNSVVEFAFKKKKNSQLLRNEYEQCSSNYKTK